MQEKTVKRELSPPTVDCKEYDLGTRSKLDIEPCPLTDADVVKDKAVWRKLDLRLLPTLMMFLVLSYVDRTNLGNARVAGMQKQLKMTDRQYSTALTITYVPFIASELPSNLLLKIVGPNVLLPTLLSLWGVVTTLQGLVTSYEGLLCTRFFLGLLEGGVVPGVVLYLSFFYPRQKLQWRISIFYSSAAVSAAFSGLLAYGIINMDGIGGRPGWAWIFILEGLFTFMFGIASFFLLPHSLTRAPFLTVEEMAYIDDKLKGDGSSGEREAVDRFSWREVRRGFALPHVWMVSVVFFLMGTVIFSLAYFTPTIITQLGYTNAGAQLMSVPPFACAFVVTLFSAWISDHYRCRGIVTMASCTLSMVGFAMYLSAKTNAVRYASLFFSISGTFASVPALATWAANNTAPHTRRATAVAIGFAIANCGGILATWLLGGSLSPPPFYRKATLTLLIFSALAVAITGANTSYLWLQNKKKAAIRASSTTSRDREDPSLGDKSAWFIYSV